MTDSAPLRPIAVSVVPSTGSTAMRRAATTIADPLSVVEHGRVIFFALSDDDDASISTAPSTKRIASTAAPSAAFLSRDRTTAQRRSRRLQ